MQSAESLVHSQVEEHLYRKFGQQLFVSQICADNVPTLWLGRENLVEVLQFLRPNFSMLYDLFAIDERIRVHRKGQPPSDFTVVYQLLSMEAGDHISVSLYIWSR